MSDTITYERINWKNKETAQTTPINATNLNKMDKGLDDTVKVVNALTTDVLGLKVVDSEEELPEVGEDNVIYFVKESEE